MSEDKPRSEQDQREIERLIAEIKEFRRTHKLGDVTFRELIEEGGSFS